MAKFRKFDPQAHIRGPAEAALQAQAEELIRTGRMPSLEQLEAAIAETRANYQAKILQARKSQQ